MTDAPDAAGFDAWYANMSASLRQGAIVREALGLPPELESSSLLPWAGIGEVVEQLAISAGDVLVDLACGRGGYGLEVARRTGARLLGTDFSTVAIARAQGRADADPSMQQEGARVLGWIDRSRRVVATAVRMIAS